MTFYFGWEWCSDILSARQYSADIGSSVQFKLTHTFNTQLYIIHKHKKHKHKYKNTKMGNPIGSLVQFKLTHTFNTQGRLNFMSYTNQTHNHTYKFRLKARAREK